MTTPDHTLTEAERESMDAAIHASLRGVIDRTRVHEAVETILAARLAAVEAVRDHYRVLAGLPVHAADVADRLDAALGGGAL